MLYYTSYHVLTFMSISSVAFPDALQWVNRNFAVMRELVKELQDVDVNIQSLSMQNTSEADQEARFGSLNICEFRCVL